jgi:hypothetical protein
VGTALDGGRHPATEQNVLTLMEVTLSPTLPPIVRHVAAVCASLSTRAHRPEAQRELVESGGREDGARVLSACGEWRLRHQGGKDELSGKQVRSLPQRAWSTAGKRAGVQAHCSTYAMEQRVLCGALRCVYVMGVFLAGVDRYIPGKETVYSPLFTVRGHMFQPALAAQVDNDLRMYILSRPKDAVPPAVRQLLMPEGDAQWPGGNTAADNRIPFYPMNTAGQPFYEADIQPLDPAALVSVVFPVLPSRSTCKPIRRPLTHGGHVRGESHAGASAGSLL